MPGISVMFSMVIYSYTAVVKQNVKGPLVDFHIGRNTKFNLF